MKKRTVILLGLFFFVFSSGITYVNAMASSSALTIEPERIAIGITYGGQKIIIKGKIPTGSEALVRISGGDKALHLKKKGKVWGFIWMNVKDISYEDVTILYFIRSTRSLDSLASPETLREHQIGYDAMKSKIAPDPSSDEYQLYGEMVRLREKEGLFSVKEESILRTSGTDGTDSIETDIDFPPKAAVGTYTVELIAFKDGVPETIGTDKITLERSPVIRLLTNLAVNRGLLYGCFAVFIALASGLLTGVIFGMSGKGH
jgi:uncharacterized protein (TIGR02186 family)